MHVSHEQADWFDLDFRCSCSLLGDCLLDFFDCFDSLQDFIFILAFDSHHRELFALGEDTWNLFTQHVFVDQVSESFSVFNIYSSYVFFTLSDADPERVGNNKRYQQKEGDKHLQLVLFFLQEVGESNTYSHCTLSIWVTVLQKVVSRLLVGHDGVSFGYLDEFVYCLRIVWVLVRVFFSGEFAVSFFDLRHSCISLYSQNFMRDESLQGFNVPDFQEAHQGEVPPNQKEDRLDSKSFVEPSEFVDFSSLAHSVLACLALATLERVSDGKLAFHHRNDYHIVRGWNHKEQQQRQGEVVEGRIIVIQLIFLTTLEVFLET